MEKNEYIVLAVVGLLFMLQLIYLFLLYYLKKKKKAKDQETPVEPVLPPLSVVIATSNQDYLLKKNLPAILEQEYPDYEVIVVNDNSNDETDDVLQLLQAGYPHLRTTFVPPSSRRISHRKLALTLGIKAAKNEWLVFTDADCHPVSNKWLRQMMMAKGDADAVIGYTGYESSRGLASYLRRFDNFLRGLRLLALATRGKAHMALGTNLVYRRSIFFDNKGYSAHLNLERGDDDIFVNENIRPSHIRAAVSPEAVVRCTDTSRRHWRLEQLGRIATRRHLHGIRPFLLGLDTFTRVLYILATIGAVVWAILSKWWITFGIVVFLWVIRYVCQWLVWNRSSHTLGEKAYGPAIPLLETLHPIWTLGLHIQYLFSSKQRYRRKQI